MNNETFLLFLLQLTWADIIVADMTQSLASRHPDIDIFTDHKDLKNHVNKILNLPNIKKWIENRPQTPM